MGAPMRTELLTFTASNDMERRIAQAGQKRWIGDGVSAEYSDPPQISLIVASVHQEGGQPVDDSPLPKRVVTAG